MNYKNAAIVLIGSLLLAMSFCIGFSVASRQRPVYNRVYTSDHKSIEKAMHKAGIVYTK